MFEQNISILTILKIHLQHSWLWSDIPVVWTSSFESHAVRIIYYDLQKRRYTASIEKQTSEMTRTKSHHSADKPKQHKMKKNLNLNPYQI